MTIQPDPIVLARVRAAEQYFTPLDQAAKVGGPAGTDPIIAGLPVRGQWLLRVLVTSAPQAVVALGFTEGMRAATDALTAQMPTPASSRSFRSCMHVCGLPIPGRRAA